MSGTRIASLRDNLIDSIGNFLYEEGFIKDEITKSGILEVINLISDYHEEGNALFPEVLITNNLDFFKTIPNKEIVIKEANLEIAEFKSAIKLCAPLASNGWIIFIEARDQKIKYGIASAEISETSPSIYNQTVGDLKIDSINGSTIAYIRNIGQKTVELSGLKNRLIVSLSLNIPREFKHNEVKVLSEIITSGIDEKFRINVKTLFEKVIDDALKTGHGNLIGVVEDKDESIETLKRTIISNGGIYLQSPIDFEFLVKEAELNKSNESSVNLKAHASLLKAMINHDGITIITDKGRVLGYHILIGDFLRPTDKIDGGSRSKAFKSMENCGSFKFCFYKSQDGNTKIWERK
ncbi:MAG: hypothetical protein JSS76_01050 [Bacteroidetes bacterium]|nr:hypothetical protein [Bacteroidota bacterium]